MNKDLIKAKFKASGIHLGISGIIFLGICYLILIEWYPGIFVEAEGGWNGIKLMAAVDLVLGPSLTFIIFNHLKARKEIIFDLSLVAIVQISALIWGGLQVYSERPVALVMWEGTFYTVTEDYYTKQGFSLKDVATFSDEKPLIIYAETDHSINQLERIQQLNVKKIPPFAQVHLYQNVKDNLSSVLSNQLSDELKSSTLKQIEPVTEHFSYYWAKAKYRNLLVVLDEEANLIEVKLRE